MARVKGGGPVRKSVGGNPPRGIVASRSETPPDETSSESSSDAVFEGERVAVTVTSDSGVSKEKLVPTHRYWLQKWSRRRLVAVSDSIAQLTNVTMLWLCRNRFVDVPAAVCTMTQLTELDLSENRLVRLPRAIGQLKALRVFDVTSNRLLAICHELGTLHQLRELRLQRNSLTWLPLSLARLSETLIKVFSNRLPVQIDFDFSVGDDEASFSDHGAHARLGDLFAATTHIGMIRERATEICIGLQSLGLPAFVTLQIVDEAVHRNSIRMWAKWELITAVKHFRDA
jgi:hypothetical protein